MRIVRGFYGRCRTEEKLLLVISDSVRTHFDERFKRPFTGAFVLAWVVVNWEAIAIGLLSDSTAEDRILLLKTHYFVPENTLWWPLLYAFALIIGFYVLSTMFLAIREAYGVSSAWVERKFDPARWKTPREYIELKKSHMDSIKDLTALAGDNFVELNQAKSELAALTQKYSGIQQQLSERLSDLGIATEQVVRPRLTAARRGHREMVAPSPIGCYHSE